MRALGGTSNKEEQGDSSELFSICVGFGGVWWVGFFLRFLY